MNGYSAFYQISITKMRDCFTPIRLAKSYLEKSDTLHLKQLEKEEMKNPRVSKGKKS